MSLRRTRNGRLAGRVRLPDGKTLAVPARIRLDPAWADQPCRIERAGGKIVALLPGARPEAGGGPLGRRARRNIRSLIPPVAAPVPAQPAQPAQAAQAAQAPMPPSTRIRTAPASPASAAGERKTAPPKPLPPERQAHLRMLREALREDPGADGLACKLLERSVLPGAPALRGGRDLLEGLAGLAEQPLAPGLKHLPLLSALVVEIAYPLAIRQGERLTCMAAVVQILLARHHPAELVRLVAGLAASAGRVPLANGELLARAEGTLDPDNSGRSVTARLLQPAFMEYANGPYEYDNSRDRSSLPGGKEFAGLFWDQLDRLLEAVLKAPFDSRRVWPRGDRALREIERVTARRESVPCLLSTGQDLGHAVLVIEASAQVVVVLDPKGFREELPRADFAKRLTHVSLPGKSQHWFGELGRLLHGWLGGGNVTP